MRVSEGRADVGFGSSGGCNETLWVGKTFLVIGMCCERRASLLFKSMESLMNMSPYS